MYEPSPLCLEVLDGPDQGRVIQLLQRTYRLSDLNVAGAHGHYDLTVGASRIDVDRPGGVSEVWLPREVHRLGAVSVRLMERANLDEVDAETGLMGMVAFLAQLDELLELMHSRLPPTIYLYVLKLGNLESQRAALGRTTVGIELGKLARDIGDLPDITHRARLTDTEIAVLSVRAKRTPEAIALDLERICAQSVVGGETRLTYRAFNLHASMLAALMLETCRPEGVVVPRLHRPLPENH